MSVLDAVSVSRMIPKDTLLGLLSGAYTLHGGVVRGAGGRIVAHLASPAGFTSLLPGLGWVADAFQAYELHQLGFKVDKISQQISLATQLAQAGLAVSGLNLAVSMAGFLLINRKLDNIQAQLTRIEKDTKKTRQLLEAFKYAKLKAAYDTLRHGQTGPLDQRSHCLHQAKRDFGQLVHTYRKLWQDEDDWSELQLLDDSYTMAMVGHALAANELGMHDIAAEDFSAQVEAWQVLARGFCGKEVLKDNPQRLLQATYAECLPGQDLFGVLDFVNRTDHGAQWLDTLRREETRQRKGLLSGLFQSDVVKEQPAIELSKRLRAKHNLLEGYDAHLRFLSAQQLKASEFDAQVRLKMEQAELDDACWVAHGATTLLTSRV
ncbi:hypothetical protein [Sphaerotilus sp.]|uniref:hypothetical protein n=1 Tax=Sphaerotilus sp. TaxID=2093942 RepID=UPI00286D7408|nr:hypothetical protein [Sphaerotilus sp.]